MEHEPRVPSEETQDEPRSWEAPPAVIPRIYAASLTDYNAGVLHGTWIEAAQDPDTIREAIDGMLIASPTGQAEEWAIHDHVGFCGLELDEHEKLARVNLLADGIQTYGPAFAHWVQVRGEEAEQDPRAFEEQYEGHWPSLREYGAELLDQLGIEETLDRAVPESLRPYVRSRPQYFAEDLRLAGDILTSEGDGGWYIFQGYS